MEQKKVREREREIIFDRVVVNHPNQLRYLEGLPFKEAFITAKVLETGLDVLLFDRISATLVRMSVDPMYAFRIYYI